MSVDVVTTSRVLCQRCGETNPDNLNDGHHVPSLPYLSCTRPLAGEEKK